MSNPVFDLVIFILLALSCGFGGIGVIGLLLFPDIRSRMYTAFRASVISICTMIFSVIIFSLFIFQSNGGDQYPALVIRTLVLLCIAVVANMVIYTTVIARIKNTGSCQEVANQNRKKQENR